MSMRKKLFVVFVMSVLFIALFTKDIFAASYKTSIVPSSTSVAPGGSITLTIKIASIDAGNGIWNFSAVFDYDTSIFENITDDDVKVDTTLGWSKSYTPDSKKLILENGNFITTDQDLATITLRVKADATATSGTFTLKDVKASNSESEIAGQEVSTTLSISNDAVEPIPPENGIEPENNIVEPDLNFANEVNEMLNQDTSSNEDVPYAGAEDYIVPLIAIVVVLGVISFVNYKRLDEKN